MLRTVQSELNWWNIPIASLSLSSHSVWGTVADQGNLATSLADLPFQSFMPEQNHEFFLQTTAVLVVLGSRFGVQGAPLSRPSRALVMQNF